MRRTARTPRTERTPRAPRGAATAEDRRTGRAGPRAEGAWRTAAGRVVLTFGLLVGSLLSGLLAAPQHAAAAQASVVVDKAARTVTMTDGGFRMVYSYGGRSVVTSFTMGGTQLLDAGIYSSVRLGADGSELASTALAADPSVTVHGRSVTASFTMANARVALEETWRFDLTGTGIELSSSRGYDWLDTSDRSVRHNGQLTFGWARVWDNIRRPQDGGDLPLGNAYTGQNSFFLSQNLDRYGVEESDFTMLRGSTRQALSVTATGNRNIATEFSYTGDGNTYQETELSTSPTWNYTAGSAASGLVYGGHSSNGTDAYVFAPVTTSPSQRDTVSYTFAADDYARYYSLGGTIKGVADTAALTSLLNDFGRSGVIDKNFGMSTVGLRDPGVGPYDMVYADRTVQGYYDPAMTASQQRLLTYFRDTAQSSSGHMAGRTYHLDHPWGDGSLYDADPSYASAVADMYQYSPDRTWLASMRSSVERSLAFMVDQQYDPGDGLFHNDLTSSASKKGIREWNDAQYVSYESGYVNELMYQALVQWSGLEKDVFHDTAQAGEYASIAAKLKSQFNRDDTDGGLWDPGTGMFAYWRNADGTVQGKVQQTQINLQAVYFGLVDLQRGRQILDGIDTQMRRYGLTMLPENFIALNRDTESSHGNGFETGLENGAIYPMMTEEYMRAAAVLGERSRSLTYLDNTLERYTQDGFDGWSRLTWFLTARAGGQEAWFPANANGATGLYSDVLGIQPTAAGVTVAPNIPAAMNGTAVSRTIHSADRLSVTYHNELSETVDYSAARQPVTLQWSGQTPHATYTVTDNHGSHRATADDLGTVRYTYTGAGAHTVTLTRGSAAGYVLTTPPTPDDLAAHQPVTATSSIEDGNYGAATAVDAQPFSVAGSFGWASDSDQAENHTESLTVDLGRTTSVGSVTLWPKNFDQTLVGSDFPIDFTIDVSTDGTHWTTAVAKTGYPKPVDGSPQAFAFGPQSARYVRVQGTDLRADESGAYQMQLAEVQVYAP
ncbi:discoidin domain-containing protein [Streptomyces sp. CA2R106]|uniref:discoidin domain-containing protein n=1 Tax=Streptomyces sp. CA2R106 TaxID=3120153 RepID=UPI00300BAA65